MPFTYHPPTGRKCEVCEYLQTHDNVTPITENGKASSANNFPFHNWYNFVLGYSPEFPQYMLQREGISALDLVADPFMGTGTTLVTCKQAAIPSIGLDANNFMVDAARTKLNWQVDLKQLQSLYDKFMQASETTFQAYDWQNSETVQMPLFATTKTPNRAYQEIVARRPALLLPKYISDKPFAKATLIADVIQTLLLNHPLREFFDLALTSIIVPISNIRYGPGFGVVKMKDDVDVLGLFVARMNRMIADLKTLNGTQSTTPSQVFLGDARCLSRYFPLEQIAFMITSPPYPGDHEYTKHTKLELLFRGYAASHQEFQIIKKRMIRASTTNIYKEDNDRACVVDFQSIQAITQLIHQRLEEDGATSGFEKLYTKLVWEYFGGMYKSLAECLITLRSGGKIALLVSDSHAFKMVHIETAKILCEIGVSLGYINPEIILWQNKTSTSHQYMLRENILILQKP